jgi:hypothetical protein
VEIRLLNVRLSVCRLPPAAAVPPWAAEGGEFVSITRTTDELSIVCPEAAVPADVAHEPGWRALKVAGPLDFALVGILASIAGPLAQAGIPIFAVSTYDTDYVLVKNEYTEKAIRAVSDAGHTVVRETR